MIDSDDINELPTGVRCELLSLAMHVPLEWPNPRIAKVIYVPCDREAYMAEYLRDLEGLTEEERENLAAIMRLPNEVTRTLILQGIPSRFDGLSLRQLLEILEREHNGKGHLPRI